MRAVGRIDLDHVATLSQGVSELVAELCRRYHIEAIYAFGSFARGELHEGSDIDLLIVGEIPGRFHERIGHVLALTALPVEPLVYTADELQRLQAEGHPLVTRALAEGRRLDPSPAQSPLSIREQQALQWLAAHLRIALGRSVQSIRFFGSRARGEGHPHSDLDIALVVDRDDDRAEDVAWDAMVDIMGCYDVTCEIIVLGAQEYAKALVHQRPFELNVELEGIPL